MEILDIIGVIVFFGGCLYAFIKSFSGPTYKNPSCGHPQKPRFQSAHDYFSMEKKLRLKKEEQLKKEKERKKPPDV